MATALKSKSSTSTPITAELPIILRKSCFSDTRPSLASVAWEFGCYMSQLEASGVAWHELPSTLRQIATFGTACGGRKSNGVRTALGNLVVLEGQKFTRAFLTDAAQGADLLDLHDLKTSFLAELDWLDHLGSTAGEVLRDRDQTLPMGEALTNAFFYGRKLNEYTRDEVVKALEPDMRAFFLQAEAATPYDMDGPNVALFAYLMGHDGTEILQVEEGDDGTAAWEARVAACARRLRDHADFAKLATLENPKRNPRAMN